GERTASASDVELAEVNRHGVDVCAFFERGVGMESYERAVVDRHGFHDFTGKAFAGAGEGERSELSAWRVEGCGERAGGGFAIGVELHAAAGVKRDAIGIGRRAGAEDGDTGIRVVVAGGRKRRGERAGESDDDVAEHDRRRVDRAVVDDGRGDVDDIGTI